MTPIDAYAADRGDTAGAVRRDGVIRLDVELRIASLDEVAEELLCNCPSAVLGCRVDDVVNVGNLVNLMGSGISFSNQTLVVGNRQLLCNYTPLLEEGKSYGGVLTLSFPDDDRDDTTELNELLRSANSFMNLDYDGIIIVDRHGKVVLVNQSFADVLDTTPQTMIGKHIHKAYHNSQASRMPLVIETGRPEIGYVHYMNGREVISSRFPLIKDGKVIGCMGKILFKDIREITLIANRLQNTPETRSQSRSVAGKESLFKYDVNSIIGQSSKMAELKQSLLKVAGKGSNVLLRGESGTGKELFAHALHAASPRRYAAFVKVNCAAIPEHLLESELFGYAEGAFTGAKKGGQVGKFEQAHTGTIFLDEIGDMPLSMQVKMLRVLQEKELTQLGSTRPKTVDVRVVAATNSNLEQLVKDGKFREDLYYRLNVVSLNIPALRERKEDIAVITNHLISQFNIEFGLEIQGLDAEAWGLIRAYDWPGNIRELRNVLESAFNVTTGPLIRREDLPTQLARLIHGNAAQTPSAPLPGFVEDLSLGLGSKSLEEIVESFERLVIEKALERCKGNKLQAAQLLRISRPGFYKKLQKLSGQGVLAT
ncbi:MAG TPA: sigma-54-dependent Fis family transcriptional regulator [Geobacter sp.]|nr:sigma-54-dependent Fis family transcriptional regulator [Geobacter sp.]